MATNFINNLSNTYRGSPSLQNQFATEQDYIDLFDTNRTTPGMATAYVPAKDTTGIKSIVNTTPTIINQGGGADTDPTGPTKGFSTQGAPYGNAKGGIHDYSGTGIAGTGITGKGLMAALGFAINPIGFFIGRYAKKTYKAYKEKKEKERIQKEKERKAAANAYDYKGRSNEYGTHYSTISKEKAASNREGRRGGTTGGYSTASHGQAMHGARGGFVPTGLSRGSYFNGGIVSLWRR